MYVLRCSGLHLLHSLPAPISAARPAALLWSFSTCVGSQPSLEADRQMEVPSVWLSAKLPAAQCNHTMLKTKRAWTNGGGDWRIYSDGNKSDHPHNYTHEPKQTLARRNGQSEKQHTATTTTQKDNHASKDRHQQATTPKNESTKKRTHACDHRLILCQRTHASPT